MKTLDKNKNTGFNLFSIWNPKKLITQKLASISESRDWTIFSFFYIVALDLSITVWDRSMIYIIKIYKLYFLFIFD